MPGKYDPEGISKPRSEWGKRQDRALPEIPHFLTDEEWYASENYRILYRNCIKKGDK